METKVKEIIFICENCKSTLKAPGDGAGKQGRCPSCNHKVIVPEKSKNDNQVNE